MELSGSSIKKFLIFSRKKALLRFQETKLFLFHDTETPKKLFVYFRKRKPRKISCFKKQNFLIFQEVTLRARKIKRTNYPYEGITILF